MTTTPIKTQCPHCHACFNLQRIQLNQAGTTVRCNHCQQVFLVNEYLVVNTDAAINTVTTDIRASVPNTAENVWLEQLLKDKSDVEDGGQPETDLAQLLLNREGPVNEEVKVKIDPKYANNTRIHMQSTPMETGTSIVVLLWTMGCLVLVLLLFAQYVIFNLDTLIKNPAHAERLQTVCAIAACSLPSADLTTMTVTGLNYSASRISATNTFSDVTGTLNNTSSQPQLLPSLKVSIYSPNVLIGEFIAMPDDYLLSPQNQLVAEGHKQLMFTIPVAADQIDRISINPIY
ncbi:putative Zn finger-like uncharacterized protein [Psychrobacter sp. PL19]|uniref:DUF3426 domain-containing protein n=1 Tax=Psychrobacter sp. PL19 TaxID=2760711 RepID=UPI001AE8D8B8